MGLTEAQRAEAARLASEFDRGTYLAHDIIDAATLLDALASTGDAAKAEPPNTVAGAIDANCRFVVWWPRHRNQFTTTRQAAWKAWHDSLAAATPSPSQGEADDAARLDWLEKNWFYVDSSGELTFGFDETWTAGSHESLRAAIDAARKKEGA